jgi:hypothetical protein
LLSRTPYLPNPLFAMSSFHARALLSLTPDAYDHASTTGVLPSYRAFNFQFPDEPSWLDHGPYDRYHMPSTILSIGVLQFAMSTSTHPPDSRFPETRWLMVVDLSMIHSPPRKPATCIPLALVVPHANRRLPRYRFSRSRDSGRKSFQLQLTTLRVRDMPMRLPTPVPHYGL